MKPLARSLAFTLTAALFLLATGCGSDDKKKTDAPAGKEPPATVGDPNALPVVKDQKGKAPVINTGDDK